MTPTLALHPLTASTLQQCALRPPHALLITGSDGIGKGTLATHIAAAALRLQPGQLADYPHQLRIVPDEKNTISIDAIRQLQKFLQLKTPGQEAIRRACIVEHADRMTTEAQNAFLKMLEEPPADTILILTAATKRQLLPTIISRVQVFAVQPPAEAELQTHFRATGHDAAAIRQAFFLSGGLPGLMHALLDDASHPMLASVQTAKELLKQTPFERLCTAEMLAKQKTQALAVFEALGRIASTMLEQAAAKGANGQMKQWHRVLSISQEVIDQLAHNGNTKLILSVAMLRM